MVATMHGGFSWILIAILAAALALAAARDWQSRIIPNWLNGSIALLAIPFWWSIGLSLWPDIVLQLAVGATLLGLFSLAFAAGLMGGGDVKMLAALALWLPPLEMLQLLLIMSAAGGVLTLVMMISHRLAKSANPLEIPYGIAIAFAGFWVISERILNQFA
ncbi:A24 family peptidase [Sphingosinicella rhizophila]|uniref:Prepilin peptidase n=1 Tax=Sphingosinicella rhizophila TaxID=3050082 RepID=A0ABU3Q5V9_9SPHN|nr:prepilin peptidase [Sphingosinicella sp. GR2756]MDT9598459.1 prepilin peptidase [Sphingosinicella sp. GR2756]